MTRQKRSVVLACFSPPVMVATFAIETVLAIYTILRFKLDSKGRTIVAMLVCLASFQLAEYYVCTQSNIATNAARAGYVAITLLPALGFYLMSLLTKPLPRKVAIGMFGATAAIAAYFLVAPQAFSGYVCTGNYVIFQMGLGQAYVYGVFYFGLIAASVRKGALYLRNTRLSPQKTRGVRLLILGYAVFVTPVAIILVFRPATFAAIPSILCGFAVTFAIVLGVRVAPATLKSR